MKEDIFQMSSFFISISYPNNFNSYSYFTKSVIFIVHSLVVPSAAVT